MRGKVTGESAIKPEYTGQGLLVLEPTYKHLLLIDLDEWNNSIVLDDGLFLACDASLKHKAVMRSKDVYKRQVNEIDDNELNDNIY